MDKPTNSLRVFVIAPGHEDIQSLVRAFEGISGCSITTFQKLDVAISAAHRSPVDLILARDHKQEFAELLQNNLSSLLEKTQIVALAEEFSDPLLALAAQEDKLLFLHLPISDANLRRVIQKIVRSEIVQQQRHPRYPTQQSADIEVYGNEALNEAEIKNLSLSGAMLHFQYLNNVVLGDILQVSIKLDQLKKVRQVNAEVIWIDKQAPSDGVAMGVCFVDSSRVFDKLIEKSMS